MTTRVRDLPSAAWILFVGTFINRFGSFVLVFLVLYLRDRGFSAAQAGLAVTAYGIGGLGAAVLGGHLADRVGRRNTIALSMFSAAASMVALSEARAYPLIVLLAALTGLTAEAYRPASAAMLADFTRAGERVTVFALYRLAINLGTTAGPAIGGLVAERSFALLFYGDALTCVVFGTIALTALPADRKAPTAEARTVPLWRVVLRDRRFTRVMLGATLAAVVFFQVVAGLPLQIEARGWSSAVYGGLLALNGLLVMGLELPLTTVTRRFPAPYMIALGYVLIGLGYGLTAVAVSLSLLVVTVILWTLGEIVSAPVGQAYVADLAPDDLRGRYQGAYGLTFGLGLVLGPALGAWAFAWNPAMLWVGCGVLAAAAVAAVAPLAWFPPLRGDD